MYYVGTEPQKSTVITLRIAPEELEALDHVARRMRLPRSALIRAGLRAVVADPSLVWGSPVAEVVSIARDGFDAAEGDSPFSVAPPASPRKRNRSGRGKRRR
jgi:hypothetical protein